MLRTHSSLITRLAVIAAVCTILGVLLVGARPSTYTTLTVGIAPEAFAASTPSTSTEPTASADLPTLLEMWGVGGGPSVPLQDIEPPEGIRAGAPLRVDVACVTPAHEPLVGASVQIDWLLGSKRYHDVGYTDKRGNVSVVRDIDREARGERCFVSVRVFQDDMQAFAYSVFIPE